jgi:hypothetical protein
VKQPSCANCDKKNLECSFLLLAPTSRLSIKPPTSPRTPQIADVSPSLTSDLEYATTSSHVSSIHSNSPNSETSIFPVTPSTQNDPFFEDDIIYYPEPVSGFASPQNVPYFSLDLTVPLDVTTISPIFNISPSLPILTPWSPIIPSLPASLRTLLSHYEYTTTLTLHPSDPAKAAWLTHLPSLAINHAYLLNCVLSISSLHIGRLHDRNTPKRLEMNTFAAARMNKALSTYRAELTNVTRDNAAALFAAATLTAVYLFRTTSLDMDELRSSIPPASTSTSFTTPHTLGTEMLACALRPIWGLRGPLTVLMSGWTWVTSGSMQSVAARKWWPSPIVPATPSAVIEDARLSALHALDEDTQQAKEYLREAYALVSQLTLRDNMYPRMTAIPYAISDDDGDVGVLTDRGAIFVWATRISRGFMRRIEAQERDALVLLAHYAVLPGRVRNVWWLEGLGADIVSAIAMVLGREVWPLIEWPASVVGVDLENLGMQRKDELEGRPEELGMEVI